MDRQKSDIFSLEKIVTPSQSDSDIMSVDGLRHAKINRLKGTCSNVFPVGCMGNLGLPRDEIKRLSSPRSETDKNAEVKESPRIELSNGDTDKELEKEIKPKRNILTGEGIESADMPRTVISSHICYQYDESRSHSNRYIIKTTSLTNQIQFASATLTTQSTRRELAVSDLDKPGQVKKPPRPPKKLFSDYSKAPKLVQLKVPLQSNVQPTLRNLRLGDVSARRKGCDTAPGAFLSVEEER
ncbi:hypothetical protein FQA39_LY08250 [Lamprigera yunnana]|nr:hypothetical protein FQA39_LY08250 [Lamprigera yunnana]